MPPHVPGHLGAVRVDRDDLALGDHGDLVPAQRIQPDLGLIVAGLDDATLYKRDRVAACAECADQSCGTCRWRVQAAGTYATWPPSSRKQRRPHEPQPPATQGPPTSPSPQQTGRLASDPEA
jgi:hypothetical protein